MRFDLAVRDPDGGSWAGGAKLTPAQDSFAFLDVLEGLWRAMTDEFKPRRLLTVSVAFHDLCRREEITPDLFEPEVADTAGPPHSGDRQGEQAVRRRRCADRDRSLNAGRICQDENLLYADPRSGRVERGRGRARSKRPRRRARRRGFRTSPP